MEDAEMDKSFYDKLAARGFRPLTLFDVDKAKEGFEQAAKEVEKKELTALRDHFAGLAMQGLMTAYWDTFDCYENSQALVKCQVETAYEYADAMLKQRSLTND